MFVTTHQKDEEWVRNQQPKYKCQCICQKTNMDSVRLTEQLEDSQEHSCDYSNTGSEDQWYTFG